MQIITTARLGYYYKCGTTLHHAWASVMTNNITIHTCMGVIN